MTRRSPKPISKKLRSIYSWHRWLGIISAVFIVWLSISGIILEHSHQLGLGNKTISNPWLLQKFGIEISAPTSAYQYDDSWLSQIDGRLYLNFQMIDQGPAPVGFTRMGLLWAVATRETLWLLNDQGEILEKIEGLDLPGRITALSHSDHGLLLQTDRGNFTADPLSPNWPAWQTSVREVTPEYRKESLPLNHQAQLLKQAQRKALNWERVVLDAHSGRLFGKYGVLLVDAMAVVFIVLGVTGIALWLRYRRAAQKRKKKFRAN